MRSSTGGWVENNRDSESPPGLVGMMKNAFMGSVARRSRSGDRPTPSEMATSAEAS